MAITAEELQAREVAASLATEELVRTADELTAVALMCEMNGYLEGRRVALKARKQLLEICKVILERLIYERKQMQAAEAAEQEMQDEDA